VRFETRNYLSLVIAFLGSAMLWACAASPDTRRDSFGIAMNAAAINAGQTGRAIFTPLGDQTQVTIIVSGVPPELVARPVHLYTFLYRGSCGNLASESSYSLTENVLAQTPASSAVAPIGRPLTVANVAPVALDELRRESYAVRVTTSPADGNREIFCGDIR
jgi:hypothetical protein